MSSFSKVAWKEGLFLQPQHLQQADRYAERLIRSRTEAITPYPWGLTEFQMDRDLAQQGRIALRRVAGIMPDGTCFDAPGIDPLPVPVPIEDDAKDLAVWLTLPDASQNGRDVGIGAGSETTRFVLDAVTVADNASEQRLEQPVEVAHPRLELDVRQTPKPGYQCLKIARIAEVRDGVVAFDDQLPPPALIIGVHPVIVGFLSRVTGWVEAKLQSLARYAADPTSGGMQAADYMMLTTLNREITGLRHLSTMRNVHPERLFDKLIALAGELASFDGADRMARTYGPYDHAALRDSFQPVVQDIQRFLSRDLGRAVRLDLRQVRQNAFIAEVADRNLFRDATFVIEVASSRPLGQVQAQFPQLCKLGPSTEMSVIVKNNLPGIPLLHLPNPPRQIRVISSNVYFLLDKNTPLWPAFSTAPAIGMHFAGDWPDLKMELWAIPEKA